VNNLQRMGGIVGGVAGVGDQEARIAERQAKAAEMVENLTKESLKKLDDIEKRIRELGE
jgi:F0F1-type ATP synthase membrane subunit b/b'